MKDIPLMACSINEIKIVNGGLKEKKGPENWQEPKYAVRGGREGQTTDSVPNLTHLRPASVFFRTAINFISFLYTIKKKFLSSNNPRESKHSSRRSKIPGQAEGSPRRMRVPRNVFILRFVLRYGPLANTHHHRKMNERGIRHSDILSDDKQCEQTRPLSFFFRFRWNGCVLSWNAHKKNNPWQIGPRCLSEGVLINCSVLNDWSIATEELEDLPNLLKRWSTPTAASPVLGAIATFRDIWNASIPRRHKLNLNVILRNTERLSNLSNRPSTRYLQKFKCYLKQRGVSRAERTTR